MMCTYFRVHVTYIPPPHPTNFLTAADTITAHTDGPSFLAAEGGCLLPTPSRVHSFTKCILVL